MGILADCAPVNDMNGVKAPKSFGSSEIGAKGREFNIDSMDATPVAYQRKTTNESLIFHSLPLNHPNLGDSPLTADVEDLASHPLNAPRLFFHSMEFLGAAEE